MRFIRNKLSDMITLDFFYINCKESLEVTLIKLLKMVTLLKLNNTAMLKKILYDVKIFRVQNNFNIKITNLQI